MQRLVRYKKPGLPRRGTIMIEWLFYYWLAMAIIGVILQGMLIYKSNEPKEENPWPGAFLLGLFGFAVVPMTLLMALGEYLAKKLGVKQDR